MLLPDSSARGPCGKASGVVFGRRSGRGEAYTLRAHPHWEKWVGLQGLVSDGVAFCRSGRKTPREIEDNKREKAGRHGKKHKDKNKEKHKGKGKPGSGSSSVAATTVDDTADGEEPIITEREWAPTQTGLLSIGARETGVKIVSG